jgi:hypothetical protein
VVGRYSAAVSASSVCRLGLGGRRVVPEGRRRAWDCARRADLVLAMQGFFSGSRDTGARRTCEYWSMAYGFMFCWFGLLFLDRDGEAGVSWTLDIAVCTVSIPCSQPVVLVKSSVECLDIAAQYPLL